MAVHDWQKSSFSGDAANCIYVSALTDCTLRIRESDDPDVILTTTPASLRALLRGIQAGEFDHLAQ
ncbi:DUF397 domain-containing protein [Streptomyces rubellomurinus]|uniref:DUF397 domain-containing protein n=2 Tax=Streptomyces TaxID=1883 RepID=A0A0F2T6Z3_STRR3|nr:DUF397 domain-containing protein [Streptomyces rubellomurinus]KJS52624.1 hypothetical protein VM98_30220 [Streptomyces rubellomurinus subsp. indigoferus]KJS58989.1 hypothetical protein VM95_29900 [Streptomyces rubellomurinus]